MDKLAEEKKKWVALYGTGSLTIRFDYGYLTEEEVQESLQEWATKTGYDVDNVILYSIGTKEEEEEGCLFFCPRCGAHNEYGMEPSTRLFYREDKEGNTKPAGYFKSTWVECTNCDNTYEVHSDKYHEDVKEMNKLFAVGEESES
jgi:hypothetical protein